MIFTLEALRAKHGDSLLLHFGKETEPSLMVIDGGPAGVYSQSLKPRLKEIQKARAALTGKSTLPVALAMVSHIDDDHINGILQWLNDLETNAAIDCSIDGLWHNSFDDIIGSPTEADALRSSLSAAVTASLGTGGSASGLHDHSALIVASVPQGRNLRILAKKLGLTVNGGFPSGLIAIRDNKKQERRKFGPLTLTVLGPRLDRVIALQEEWKKQIKAMGVAQKAAFTDESVFNLSSQILLAEVGSHTMLLTGDARGDDILASLTQAKLFKAGVFKADVLKAPHHGSDHNVSTEFFRRVAADHYVFSGDGKHDNPELATLQMLLDARPGEKFTLHFTYPEPRIKAFLAKKKTAAKGITVNFPAAGSLGIRIDLDNPIAF